ncbi:pentapeptide repeat-containing protein [Saccharothrix obliqua]|uniref:pentapeptide repeat-containing protein n=1 Tax=Saccharothrix obliqua TaxID=2861747 RepID=UPI001C5D0C6A|nr:pentapeptide repeat-containing protein [Saccharothrix obliqua]MBW4717404.1 pentapeptide repeat-containing protein [Saccharothrix obliqua]
MIVGCVGIGIGWWLWEQTGDLSGPDLMRARAEAVRIALTASAGTGGALALLLAVRRQRSTEVALELQDVDLEQKRDAATDARHDAAERRITDLYIKAVEQLGSNKAPVRLGGLYALERLAQDYQSHRQTIVDVICAYLRMPHEASGNLEKGDVPAPVEDADDAAVAALPDRAVITTIRGQEHQVRLTAQRILAAHLRPDYDRNGIPVNPKYWPDTDLDLAGATLFALNLNRCHVRHANFGSARFDGSAVFERARFGGNVSFRAAEFTRDARFAQARLSAYSDFRAAVFGGDVRFSKVKFGGYADFRGATFGGRADFEGAALPKGSGFGAARTRGGGDIPSIWPTGWVLSPAGRDGCLPGDEGGWYCLIRANGSIASE